MLTDNLPEVHSSWDKWAMFLRDRKLEGLVAWALEAAGPLNVFLAQALYFGGPLLRPRVTNVQIDALAGMLEESSQVHAFAALLRESPRP